MGIRVCRVCGVELPPPVRSNGKQRVFCGSAACYAKAQRQARGRWVVGEWRVCAHCGGRFQPKHPSGIYCSRQCGWLFRSRRPGQLDLARAYRQSVDPAKRSEWNRRKAYRRRVSGGGKTERFTIREVGDRDRWRCHLCGRRVDANAVAQSSAGATVDHLVPVSEGGDDVRANVRLAHRGCNSSRRTGGTVQLLLVG